jgi:hypothetical protein
MRKSKVATWIVASLVIGGAGMALAETAPTQPSLESTTTTSSTEAPTSTTSSTEAPTSTTMATADTTAADPSSTQDHGALVSAAAHDHSHDAACGNHGAYVSAWAKTGQAPACATASASGTTPTTAGTTPTTAGATTASTSGKHGHGK